jgi:serine phosphatase RsbU (regulator of sigma subunit)
VAVDWRYIPASTLGGDTIGYHWIDDDHLALYLIDVTGTASTRRCCLSPSAM